MIGRRALALCAPLVLVGGLSNLGAVSAAPPARSGVTWYRTWNEAQAAARAEGKVVLATSTRAGCGLCERFRNETVPQCAGQVAQVAVGYLYDISRPEMWHVDRVIRANLPGARLMPLVGFLTPDMEWVHGFWGGRTAQQLLGDVDYVRRIRPARAVAPPAPAPVAQPRASTPPATTQVPSTQAPVAARPQATPAPPAPSAPRAFPAPQAPSVATPPSATPTPSAKPSPSVAEAPAPRVEPTPAPAAPKNEPAAPPNVPAAPAPRPGPPVISRTPGGCMPSAPFAAPSPNPTHEECCPGGVCDVPSIFEGPDCGPLPPPSSRRLMAGEPPACAPAPVFPVPGVPDTGALRRSIPSAIDGSPDGDVPTLAAKPAIARSFPPATPAPAPAPATVTPPTPTLAPWSAPRVSSTLVRPDAPSATSTAADVAAAAGDWCLVLKLTKGATDPRMVVLERRAREWAQDELNRCLNEVLAGKPESALESLRQLKVALAGEPAGVDAEHGIDAVETARDLRRLTDPSSVLARSLRRNKYDELRGTRWARLFEGA